MTQFKHSKLKNTGLIFELLVRQVASDVMNNTKPIALNIIKKFFNKKSELLKELNLYRTISDEKFSSSENATQFLNAVSNAHSKLNTLVLNRNKYNLIKEIKSKYVLEEFFKSRIKNYKLHASVYKFFEYNETVNPKEYITNKISLIEHIQTKPNKNTSDSVDLKNEHKDVRILASRIVVDRFNEKYVNLNQEQKKILKEYVNNVTNSEKLKTFILSEIKKLKENLLIYKPLVTNKIIRIKLTEVTKLLDDLSKKYIIEDKDVLTMLRYYELVSELKKLEDKQ